jgi:hypothetical protein
MSEITPQEIEEIKALIEAAQAKLDTATTYNVQRLNAVAAIGQRFLDIKAKLGNTKWIKGLEVEISVSPVTVSRWMQLAKLKQEGKLALNNKAVRDAYLKADIIPGLDGAKTGKTALPQSLYILHATRLAAALSRLDVATLSEVEVWALRARLKPIVEFASRLESMSAADEEEREDE